MPWPIIPAINTGKVAERISNLFCEYVFASTFPKEKNKQNAIWKKWSLMKGKHFFIWRTKMHSGRKIKQVGKVVKNKSWKCLQPCIHCTLLKLQWYGSMTKYHPGSWAIDMPVLLSHILLTLNNILMFKRKTYYAPLNTDVASHFKLCFPFLFRISKTWLL